MTRYSVGPAAVVSLPRLEAASTMFVIRGRGRVRREDSGRDTSGISRVRVRREDRAEEESLAPGHAYFLAAGAGAELSSDQGGLEVYRITVGSSVKE